VPALPARKQDGYTYEDYLKLPDELRCEIIDGEIYDMTPAPTTSHQDVTGTIYHFIRNHLDSKKLPCRVFVSPVDVVLSEKDIVQPDVVVVCNGSKIQRRGIFGAPDVVFEVLSPGTELKDRKKKMELYAGTGVKECFLVNPDLQFLERHIVHEDGHKGIGVYHGKDVFMIDAIGLELIVQDLFPRYEEEQPEA
jgi:Uma2 family endonuclease